MLFLETRIVTKGNCLSAFSHFAGKIVKDVQWIHERENHANQILSRKRQDTNLIYEELIAMNLQPMTILWEVLVEQRRSESMCILRKVCIGSSWDSQFLEKQKDMQVNNQSLIHIEGPTVREDRKRERVLKDRACLIRRKERVARSMKVIK